jgi:hypothetical protein
LLNRKAAENYAKFRARCPTCSTDFCAHCLTTPYHIAFTCEDFKSYQGARKCRYCKDKIEGAGASSLPAFLNICKKPECAALMQKACDKVLACGHSCFGSLLY